MISVTTYAAFLNEAKLRPLSVLIITEKGCRYCEAAERVIQTHLVTLTSTGVRIFSTSIDLEPELPTKLGLVGVPAFLKVDETGSRKLKVGLGSVEELLDFIGARVSS